MKIFGIICILIFIGVGLVDMVENFTNFVKKSRRKWVKTLFIILQIVWLIALLGIMIVGIVIL